MKKIRERAQKIELRRFWRALNLTSFIKLPPKIVYPIYCDKKSSAVMCPCSSIILRLRGFESCRPPDLALLISTDIIGLIPHCYSFFPKKMYVKLSDLIASLCFLM